MTEKRLIEIYLNETSKRRIVATDGRTTTVQLSRGRAVVLFELDGAATFHDGGALLMPTSPTGEGLDGLSYLAAALTYHASHAEQVALVAGHTPAGHELSAHRAEGVAAMLARDGERWAALAAEVGRTDDLQRILAYATTRGIDSDPGGIDGKIGPKTRGALERFRQASGVSSSAEDPVQEDWRAMFDLVLEDVRERTGAADSSQLPPLQAATKSAVGCGGDWPPEKVRLGNFSPVLVDHVDVLFFTAKDAPKLKCHEEAECNWKKCDLYRKAKYRVEQPHLEHGDEATPHAEAFVIRGHHFDTNRSFVLATAQGDLHLLEERLKAKPALKIAFFGHTDLVGSATSNQRLSERRARALRALLAHDWEVWDELRKKEGWGQPEQRRALDAVITIGADDQRHKTFVMLFQKQYGLDVDGIVGPKTWEALIKAYMERVSPRIDLSGREGEVPFAGCSEANPVIGEAGANARNRRAVVALFEQAPAFPCGSDQCPATKENSGQVMSCTFYSDFVGKHEPVDADADGQWDARLHDDGTTPGVIAVPDAEDYADEYPTEGKHYIVKSGETLESIAMDAYGFEEGAQDVFDANYDTLGGRRELTPGVMIYIPVFSDTATDRDVGTEPGGEDETAFGPVPAELTYEFFNETEAQDVSFVGPNDVEIHGSLVMSYRLESDTKVFLKDGTWPAITLTNGNNLTDLELSILQNVFLKSVHAGFSEQGRPTLGAGGEDGGFQRWGQDRQIPMEFRETVRVTVPDYRPPRGDKRYEGTVELEIAFSVQSAEGAAQPSEIQQGCIQTLEGVVMEWVRAQVSQIRVEVDYTEGDDGGAQPTYPGKVRHGGGAAQPAGYQPKNPDEEPVEEPDPLEGGTAVTLKSHINDDRYTAGNFAYRLFIRWLSESKKLGPRKADDIYRACYPSGLMGAMSFRKGLHYHKRMKVGETYILLIKARAHAAVNQAIEAEKRGELWTITVITNPREAMSALEQAGFKVVRDAHDTYSVWRAFTTDDGRLQHERVGMPMSGAQLVASARTILETEQRPSMNQAAIDYHVIKMLSWAVRSNKFYMPSFHTFQQFRSRYPNRWHQMIGLSYDHTGRFSKAYNDIQQHRDNFNAIGTWFWSASSVVTWIWNPGDSVKGNLIDITLRGGETPAEVTSWVVEQTAKGTIGEIDQDNDAEVYAAFMKKQFTENPEVWRTYMDQHGIPENERERFLERVTQVVDSEEVTPHGFDATTPDKHWAWKLPFTSTIYNLGNPNPHDDKYTDLPPYMQELEE